MTDRKERACQINDLTATVAQIEKLCDANEILIRKRAVEGSPLPKLYESGISYAPNLVTCETLLNAEAVLSRNFADVVELVAWRVAELRAGGEPAQIGVFQRVVPEGRHDGYAFVCVVRGDGRIEQPERAEHWTRPPSRCRIVVKGERWGCLSAGCGAEGDVRDGRLVYAQNEESIAAADITGPHPYVEGETCLFDRARAVVIAREQAHWWTDPIKTPPNTVEHAYEERREKPSDGVIGLVADAAVPGTFEDLVQACKNVGVDLSCGACAALFYTGSEHPGAPGAQAVEHTCARALILKQYAEACDVVQAYVQKYKPGRPGDNIFRLLVDDAERLRSGDDDGWIPPGKIPQLLTYCGQPVHVDCDHCCDKAWGRNNRPREQLSENPDDYVFLPDSALGTAPFPSLTTEGDEGKPDARYYQGRYNKWCVRECERSVMVDTGQPLVLPDFDHPKPNIRRKP